MLALAETYPTYKIRGVQMDNFTMAQQLRYFAESDIIIGK